MFYKVWVPRSGIDCCILLQPKLAPVTQVKPTIYYLLSNLGRSSTRYSLRSPSYCTPSYRFVSMTQLGDQPVHVRGVTGWHDHRVPWHSISRSRDPWGGPSITIIDLYEYSLDLGVSGLTASLLSVCYVLGKQDINQDGTWSSGYDTTAVLNHLLFNCKYIESLANALWLQVHWKFSEWQRGSWRAS